jgi:hypothetical protein
MALRFRSMQPKDVRECAEIIGAHPVIGPRYGAAIGDLRTAWLGLLGSEAMNTAVFEEVNGTAIRTCGVGVGLFVRDEFMRELKMPPLFWFGPELARRVTAGNSPVLSDSEVREENSAGGLNLIVWEAVPAPQFAARSDLFHLMVEAFLELHRGFRLKEMMTSQVESVQRLQWSVDAGGMLWDPAKKSYVKSLRRSAEEFIREPHILGITRELELGRLGSWVGTLFDYQPPLFGFSRSEQRLLQAALAAESGTDQELTRTLRVSLPTIKKMWQSVYRRVTDRRPETIRDSARAGSTERGKEKKRRLLAYLREHAEELRPASQKRLGQRSGPRG